MNAAETNAKHIHIVKVSSGSQPHINPTLGDPKTFSGLWGYLHENMLVHRDTYTHTHARAHTCNSKIKRRVTVF